MTEPSGGRKRRALVVAAEVWVLGVSTAVLLGWALHWSAIVHLLPGLPALMPITAITFLIAAATALHLLSDEAAGPLRRRTGQLLGLAVAAIGAVILGEHATGWDPGIDRLIFIDQLVRESSAPPGRPGTQSALGLLLAGLALALIDVGRRRRHVVATTLTTSTATVALLALLAYLYGFYSESTLSPGMAVHTALTLLVLTVGTVLIRPERPLVRTFSNPGPGGVLARRLAPVLVLLPFGVGLLIVAGRVLGVRIPALAITLTSAGSILVLTILIARTVRVLDDTDRAQRHLTTTLREERDFTATLLRSLDEGVLVIDLDGCILTVNPRWCAITGFSADELVGKRPPYPWWAPAERDELRAELNTRLDGNVPSSKERLVHRRDGSSTTVIATLAPMLDRDGRPRAFVATYTDITERKRAEIALDEHAAALARANAELTRAITDLGGENQFKSDVMAMLSHEMRQPMTTISGFAELIAEDPELPDLVHGHAVRITQSTQRLHELLDDLLLTFQLDAGAITARRTVVDIAEIATQAGLVLPPSVEVRTVVDPGLAAMVDPGHLRQITANLLTNAAKYGEPPVELHARRDGDSVLLSVRDHGRGVPAEFVPRLFDRFTRAQDPSTHGVVGSGLGMFIVRELARANGGTIEYSPADPGARFTVALTLAAQPVASRV